MIDSLNEQRIPGPRAGHRPGRLPSGRPAAIPRANTAAGDVNGIRTALGLLLSGVL